MPSTARTDTDRAKLIESNARLALLHGIARGITSGMSVKELVGRVLEQMHREFPGYRIAYATIDRDDVLTVMHSVEPREMPGPGPSGITFKAPRSYLDSFASGEPLVVPDVGAEPRLEEMSRIMLSCGTRAMLGAPVVLHDELIGTLCFDAAEARTWTPHEIATVKDVAAYLAVAIRNARLEEQRTTAEKAVRSSERQLQRILDTIADVVWVIRADTKEHLYINPATEAICGRSPQEFIEDSELWPRIIHPDDRDRVMTEFSRIITEGGSFDEEYRIHHTDGGIRWVHDRARAERDESGRVTLVDGAARDITERKRLEAHLQESEKMESVGRLAGGLAHDFNNVLTAISGYAALAVESLPEESPAQTHLREIKQAAGKASGLMRNLLGFARKQRISPQVVDLNETIGGLRPMLERFLGEDSALALKLDENLGRVKVDPLQIEQVLVNLTVNARDAMPSGGKVTIDTSNIEVRPEQSIDLPEGSYVTLSVRDTGSGIAPADLPHIFEPFFTTKEVGKGTGLGLATSYGIVKQHGGHIDVVSHLGFGTCFRLYFPVVDSLVADDTAGERAEPAPRGRETILVAEDEPQVRDLIRQVLAKLGYTVLSAADGREGIETAKRHGGRIDLLLTDVVMPRLGGVELAGRLERLHPGIGILYISGHAEEALQTRGMSAPAPLLPKPFFPDELAGQVRAVLDARSGRAGAQ